MNVRTQVPGDQKRCVGCAPVPVIWPNATMLSAALSYAARGWFIFPAHSSGDKKSHKAAIHSNGNAWGKTNDAEEIRRDFTRWRNANIGIATGNGSGIFVVEADTPKGHDVDGVANLKALETKQGPLPDTLMAVSPSGSPHRYFNWPAGVVIRNSTSKIAEGVDVLGEGGMVIAPPSVRPGKGSYRWLNELPIADAPQWLIDLCTAGDSNAERASGEPQANPDRVAWALSVIPNNDVGWKEWNRIGMATWRATGGEGFDAFNKWSEKSTKHNEANTRKFWKGYFKSPPKEIGAGTIFHLAEEARPGWEDDPLSDDVPAYDRVSLEKLLEEIDESGEAQAETESVQQPKEEVTAKSDTASTAQPEAKTEQPEAKTEQPEAKTEQPKDKTYVSTRASDVQMSALNWVFEGHLLRGALELLTGLPGVGKSQLHCSMVASATTGRDWPDGKTGRDPLNVIMVTAEDALATTIIPRLIAAEAQLDRVYFLKAIKKLKHEYFFKLEDYAALAQMINDIGNVGLVMIDPITAFMGGKVDSHKTTDVRNLLRPLAGLAEAKNIAISCITHPAKGNNQKAIDSFIGSQAFIAAARIGHLCVEELDENNGNQPTGRTLFFNVKNNVHIKMPARAYRIGTVTVGQDQQTRESIIAPRIIWQEGDVSTTVDQAMAAGNTKKAKTDDHAKLLEDFLRSGPKSIEEIKKHAAGHGLTMHQMRYAKEKLGNIVVVEKVGMDGGWRWSIVF